MFISAKTDDLRYARRVYNFLMGRGCEVFLGAVSLPRMGTADYRRAIDDALERADHVVVVGSSPGYITSPWVEAEWGLFITEKRAGRKPGNVISMLAGQLDPADLPLSLRGYETIRLDKAGLEKLVHYLPPAAATEDADDEASSEEETTLRRAWFTEAVQAVAEWVGAFPRWFRVAIAGLVAVLLLSLLALDLGVVASPEVVSRGLYVIAHPDEPGGHYYLADAYYKAGRYQRAIDQYLRTLELKPDSLDALWSLGVAYYNSGEKDKAQAVFLSYLEQDPESWHSDMAREYLSAMGVEPPSEAVGTEKPELRWGWAAP